MNLKITDLTLITPDGTEYIEGVVSPYSPGTNRRMTAQDIANLGTGGVTREFGRAPSQVLLFDKNYIEHAFQTVTSDITYTIAAVGNLVNQESVIRQTLIMDGVAEIHFSGAGFNHLYGITDGEVLAAGEYDIYFAYSNGAVSVSLPGATGGGGGGGTWGSITGTLSAQTDLQTALNAKFTTADASETVKGIAELATQAETETGTDDARIVTSLKTKVKNRLNTAPTGSLSIAQTHDQSVIFANSASAIVFTFPSLAQDTYLTIVNVNSGDVTWAASGTSFVGDVISIAGNSFGAVTFWYRTTTSIQLIAGNITNLAFLNVAGALSIKAGNSTGTIAKAGGTILSSVTQVGNIGTGEDIIYTLSIPAATLNIDKSSIHGFVAGTFAANANAKQVKLKFGATTIIATGALNFNTGDWRIDFDIIRTGATTQKAICRFTSSNALLTTHTDYTTPAETLSGAVSLVVTGEATTNDDILGQLIKVMWSPNE